VRWVTTGKSSHFGDPTIPLDSFIDLDLMGMERGENIVRNIAIDGVVHEAQPGEFLIDLINRAGGSVLHVCYHIRLAAAIRRHKRSSRAGRSHGFSSSLWKSPPLAKEFELATREDLGWSPMRLISTSDSRIPRHTS
jgi:hypothetical protein